MLYDQGFEIRNDGRRYIAYFRYEPKSPSSDFTKVEEYNSICSETYTGWYRDDDGKCN